MAVMLGPIIMVLVLLVVIPVGFLMSTSIVAALVGLLLKDTAEKSDPESELLTTNY